MSYQEEYRNYLADPGEFWQSKSDLIQWFKKPTKALTKDENGFYRWYADGKLNTAYLALDYHLEQGRGDALALIYDSPVTGVKKKITYRELTEKVAKFAGALKKLGLAKGDTAVIYLPMIEETIVSMLACARLGVIHSVVFGGFAPPELAARINHAKPKVIVTASCGIEFSRVIAYKPLVDEALELSGHEVEKVIVKKREQLTDFVTNPTRDLDFDALVESSEPTGWVEVEGTHPLYILYTSGTTGKPKGVVRDNGGHAVALKYSMKTVYNAKAGDVFWSASDVGWVVGHSYIVYAPLLQGCTTIIFEGKPVKTPDAGTFWRVMSEHKVKLFFTAPTAFRAIKKEDPEGELSKKYDLSSLKHVFLAGERLDPPTYHWLKNLLKIDIIDNWWQTETGWPIVANPVGLEKFPVKIGSSTFPVPGYDVKIVDEEGVEVPDGTSGYIVLKLPLPPGSFPTLWQDNERFKENYLAFKEGYYLAGDGGYKDADGYVFIMGRVDDVINVSGHRLSTGEIEEIIGSHPSVAECAVIGLHDDIKGQVPLSLSVIKDGYTISSEKLEIELIDLVRSRLGAVASFKKNILVKRLPKTRSGKILRKSIRLISQKEDFSVPSTIDDPAILTEIRDAFKERGVT